MQVQGGSTFIKLDLVHTGSLVAGQHGQAPRMAFGASNSSSMAI